jgi:hypothetical protein
LSDALTSLLTFDLRRLEEAEGFLELFAGGAERQIQAPEISALGRGDREIFHFAATL